MQKLSELDSKSLRSDVPGFNPGDTVNVHVRVVEGNRSRIQVFKGVVIRRQGDGVRETFTVRKVSFGGRRGAHLPGAHPGDREDRDRHARRRAPGEALLPARSARQEGEDQGEGSTTRGSPGPAGTGDLLFPVSPSVPPPGTGVGSPFSGGIGSLRRWRHRRAARCEATGGPAWERAAAPAQTDPAVAGDPDPPGYRAAARPLASRLSWSRRSTSPRSRWRTRSCPATGCW